MAGPVGGVDADGVESVADVADMVVGENRGAGGEGGGCSLEVEWSRLPGGCGVPRMCALVSTS